MEKILNILASRPTTSIIAFTVLAIVFMYFFKSSIRSYLLKRFKLYTRKDMQEFATGYHCDKVFKEGKYNDEINLALKAYRADKNT